MRIVADNRGRIALSKLNAGYRAKDEITSVAPGSEWDVTIHRGQVVLKPVSDEPEDEWVKIHPEKLRPEMIGTVVGVYSESCAELKRLETGAKDGVWGVLETYALDGSYSDLALTGGHRASTNPGEPKDPRLQYVWVRRDLV